MTGDELEYALSQFVAWISYGLFITALAVALRVTWPRWK